MHDSLTTHKSACILCSLNCGIDAHVDAQGQLVKVTGDKDHPTSQGYICQKATRLPYYQHQKRLTSPLRKKPDGSFEEISWEVAIQEIADKLVQIRDTHGGETIAYAGGGGQGNHFPGAYASATRAACETPYFYSALAQEKTGNFWVHGKLFGRQNTNYAEPVDKAEYVLIIGANPMQAHGISQARNVINKLSRDPNRTLVVIDPRNTETARKADIFLQVNPGRDAFLMAAMLGAIIQEGLEDRAFIDQHTVGFEEIKPHFMEIPVADYAQIAGIDPATVQRVARDMTAAKSVVIRSDLGIEHSHNSTLNAYLKRLLFLVTGNFGKKDTNHLTTWFFPLIGHSPDPGEGGRVTPVTQSQEICKLFPPNILPKEIDSDHPQRLRALIVESANPLSSYADISAQQKAYEKLELMVVIDVAMTETARAAHYVLPASSQFEKYEATFFSENFFQLRRPIVQPLAGTLPEAEIHTRLVRAMGELPQSFPLLRAIARLDRKVPGLKLFPAALGITFKINPRWQKHGVVVLRETLGKVLPNGAADAAFLWFTSHVFAKKYPKSIRNAGFIEKGSALGEAIFNKILHSPSGVVLSKPAIEDHWKLVRHPDKKVHLSIPKLLNWLSHLPETHEKILEKERAYPFNLIAGERRTYNANSILRNPEWRKSDAEGALKINPDDAQHLRIENGDTVRVTNDAGSILILCKIAEEMPPGVLSMPHGYGLTYEGKQDYRQTGAMANLLTAADDCDPLARTPYHKHVRVQIEKV